VFARILDLCRGRCALSVLSLAVISSTSHFAQAAAVIVDSGGFESYTLGQLEGQNGWLSAGAGAGSATVQTSVVSTGSKAVTVQKGALVDRRWAVPVAGQPAHRFVEIDWDMRVVGTGAPNTVFGPFFGVETNDDADGMPVKVLGTLGVDATTGDIVYQLPQSGVIANTGVLAAFNTWNNYRLILDFTTHQYSGFVNGIELVTTGFVDNTAAQPLNHFTDADIATFALQSDFASASQTGTAYFDNFRVTDGIVADFNNDGKVNGADLTVWESSLGPSALGDANFDGRTDGADFLVWQQRQQLDVVTAAAVASAVPEPGAAVLALVAAVCAAARRRVLRTEG
jgi:hypothetical protein